MVEDVLESFGDLPVYEVQVRDLLINTRLVKNKLGCIVCGLPRINVWSLDRAGLVLQILIVEPAEGVDKLVAKPQLLPSLDLFQVLKVLREQPEDLQGLKGDTRRHRLDVRDEDLDNIFVLHQFSAVLRILAGRC
jgi:hypothetical protein